MAVLAQKGHHEMTKSLSKVLMSLTNYLSQRAYFRLVLALPVILYLAVALFWQSHQFYRLTGDEPHYLLITDSLVRDHDLLVLNNYSIDTPVQRATGAKLDAPGHVEAHTDNQFSNHSPGLAFILVVPYWIAGVIGTKIFMALIAGLWPLLLYRALFQITESERWSALVALFLAIGLPFSAASNQIYPDLLAGMIILCVTLKIFVRLQDQHRHSFSFLTDLWTGLLLALLPWLDVRFILPAVLLLVVYTYIGIRTPGESPTGSLRFQNLAPAGMVSCSVVLLHLYSQIAFGTFFGFYHQDYFSFGVREIGMILSGLHWDQTQGVFIQQPLFLLGLVGIALLIKANRQIAILLGILYVSFLLPNATQPALYGGFSFVGRSWWAVFALWVFPLAYVVKLLLAKNRIVLSALCGASIALQGWYAGKWLFLDDFLLNRNVPTWVGRSFFDHTGLLPWMPTFRDFDSYLKHPANYIFVLLGLLLIISGWLWHRGTNRLLAGVWGGFLVVGIATMLLVSPSPGSWKLDAIELPSQVGTLEGTSRVATEKDGPGALIFGPYTMLMAGRYQAKLEYESSDAAGLAVAHFDIVYGMDTKVVADVELPNSDANQGTFKYEFPVAAGQSLNPPFQFRVMYAGRGNLKVKRLTITPVSFQ